MLFAFLNLYVEKKTLAKAVVCMMIFNTASTMTNLSLNSQNRLFLCSGIGLLIGFLVFYLIKIIFVKPKVCASLFFYIKVKKIKEQLVTSNGVFF